MCHVVVATLCDGGSLDPGVVISALVYQLLMILAEIKEVFVLLFEPLRLLPKEHQWGNEHHRNGNCKEARAKKDHRSYIFKLPRRNHKNGATPGTAYCYTSENHSSNDAATHMPAHKHSRTFYALYFVEGLQSFTRPFTRQRPSDGWADLCLKDFVFRTTIFVEG